MDIPDSKLITKNKIKGISLFFFINKYNNKYNMDPINKIENMAP